MSTEKLTKYQSIYDPDMIFYALEHDGVEKDISGERFIEVTSDFKRVQFIKADSLVSIGTILKDF